MIDDVRGEQLIVNDNDELTEFVPGEEPKTWLQKRFGIYWVGWPPASRVLYFDIDVEKENPAGTGPDNWTSKKEKRTVSSLRHTFPIPFTLKGVELGDRTTVDLLAVGTFRVKRPYIAVIKLKGDFSLRANARIRASVGDITKAIPNITAFIAEDKSEETGMLKDLKDPISTFNIGLIRHVGLELVEISIPQFNADKAMLEAANREAIAILDGKAKIATADARKKALEIDTEADAARVVALGKARGEQISATVAAISTTGGNKDAVTKAAAEILTMEAATSETSKLTTLVQGGASPVVPVGGNKP